MEGSQPRATADRTTGNPGVSSKFELPPRSPNIDATDSFRGLLMEGASLGPIFQPGDVCPNGGTYEVTHRAHRAPHMVVVRKGELFPRCNGCGDSVRFRFLKPAAEECVLKLERRTHKHCA
jgi:hypothetical protein